MNLSQRLQLQVIQHSFTLLQPATDSSDPLPAHAVGWDRLTGNPIVAIAGAKQPVQALQNSGLVLGRSVQVSGEFGDW